MESKVGKTLECTHPEGPCDHEVCGLCATCQHSVIAQTQKEGANADIHEA